MRLRHIPGAEQMIEESPYVIQEPEQKKGSWKEIFGNDHPVHIEIGMGKGRFIIEMAERHPEINYIGIERYSTVMVKALRKREQTSLTNLYFMRIDARLLADVFAPGEVEKIYLNFSDPWPKDRHAGRRLTSPQFMAVYHHFLAADGSVEFKTDNRELFDYSMESIPEAGWKILASTFDLHHDAVMCEGNVMTEYETKFSAEGKPICKLIAIR